MLEQEVQHSGAGQRGPAPRRALAGIRSEGLEVICQRGGGGGGRSRAACWEPRVQGKGSVSVAFQPEANSRFGSRRSAKLSCAT